MRTENGEGKIHLLRPILDNRYYDPEFGNLSHNAKSINIENIYEHLDKLTPTFPKYQNFINQIFIDFRDQKSKKLIVELEENKTSNINQKVKYEMPLVYLT